MILVHASNLKWFLQKFTLPGWRWNGYTSERMHGTEAKPLELSNELVNLLKTQMQDMVIYGSAAHTDRCNIFEEIWPPLKDYIRYEYVIRDWETDGSDNWDTSANRCVTHAKPLSPNAWKIGELSPGYPNNCVNSVAFIVSQNLDILGVTNQPQLREQDQCTSTRASDATYRSILPATYQAAVRHEIAQTSGSCTGSNPEAEVTSKMFELTRLSALIEKFRENKIFPWLNTDRFSQTMRDFLENFLYEYLDMEYTLSNHVTPWLGFTPNHTHPEQSQFWCMLCIAFTENCNRYDRPSSSLIKPLMTQSGYKLNCGQRARIVNKNYFKAHETSRMHLDVINWLKEQVGERVLQDLNEALLEQVPAQLRHWISSINFFEQIVLFVKTGTSVRAMPKFLKQQKKYGSLIGFLYQNMKGVKDVIMDIGITNNELTLAEILKNKQPLTIILDGTTLSTDRQHYVLVYFQTIDSKNTPVLFHYRMYPIQDLTGLGYFTALMNHLESESYPIYDYVRQYLVAVVADGASTMQSTFMYQMRQWVGRPLVYVWCLAHKLDLALKHAEKSRPEFNKVMETVNVLHNHFMNSPKKYESLKARGREEGLRVHRIPRIIKVRWAPTQHSGFSTLLEMYEVIVREVHAEVNTTSGDERVRATDLFNTLTTSNFVSSLGFLHDSTAQISSVLGSLQKRGTLMISNIHKRNVLLFNARHLLLNNGPSLSSILAEAICDDITGCTLQDFETRRVTFKGFRLRHSPNEKLMDLRQPFLNKLIEQINSYFPLDLFEKYFIFNPRVLKAAKLGSISENNTRLQQQIETGFIDPDSVITFAQKSIDYFSFDSGWFNPNTEAPLVALKWNQLVQSILDDPLYLETKKNPAELFWPNALNNPLYEWDDLTRRLVKKVLTIGATSVEPESGFSVAKWLTDGRGSLDPVTLDHMMRIIYNIPDDLSKWNAVYYIMRWVDNGHCLVDDASCSTAPPDDVEENDVSTRYNPLMELGMRAVSIADINKYKKRPWTNEL